MVDIDRRQSSVVTARTVAEGRTVFGCSHQQELLDIEELSGEILEIEELSGEVLEIEEISLEELLREDRADVFCDTPPWLPEAPSSSRAWILIEDNILEEEENGDIEGGEEICDT